MGKGSYGEVFKVLRKKDNKIYVIKHVDTRDMSTDEMDSAVFEAKILSLVNSKYVCKYYDSFMDKESINIVMEFCPGGDL